MKTVDDFIGLTPNQKVLLSEYYSTNNHLLKSHLNQWKKYYSSDQMMQIINETFSRRESAHIETVEINNRLYIAVYDYNYLAIFDYETNDAYTYQCIYWKGTNLRYWSNTNSGYLISTSSSNMFRWWNSNQLQILNEFDEYKYIDFTKIKYGNPYILLNERLNKQKLWQIEMLIKQEHYLLAQDLASSYATIDFKIFKQYTDFFRKPGKCLYHYDQIIYLSNLGFNNPEFMFLQKYLYDSYGNYFVEFLNIHPEINRNRFLKYIHNRKGKETIFRVTFLYLYYQYLKEASELNLDLSKDKYSFPQDLEKAMEDHFLSINPYEYKKGKFRTLFENWQSKLPENEQSDMYISKITAVKNEEKRRVLLAKKRAVEKQKFLEFLWKFNKNVKFEINDLYILTAPTSSEELIIEGKTLNHCVGSYVERISKRETSIYFLRKKGYQDKPFYTVEIKNGKLIQCRTTNNLVNPQIEETLKIFLETRNNKIPSWDLESEIDYV